MWSLLFASLWVQQLLVQGESPKTPPARPSIAHLWPRLTSLQPEQKVQLRKLCDDYAAQIAELEAERDQRLASVLTRTQREQLAAMAADEVDRFRVVLRTKPNRPGPLAKPLRDILALEPGEAMRRLNAAPGTPLATGLPRDKANALVKALTAAGAKVEMEKQEPARP